MRIVSLIAILAAIHSAAAESAYSRYGRAIVDIPEAFRLIRAADEVYIFPVELRQDRNGAVKPYGNLETLRPLSADARRKLTRLLGKETNWFHGADNTLSVDWPRKQPGFIFQRGQDKLVLLCGLGWRLEGTFHGDPTGGSLEERAYDKFDKWKKQYAKQELGTK